MTTKPRLFGADYSVYVRAVRLVLAEKGVAYDLTPVDVFASEGVPAAHLARQPFGRIPAFEHNGFSLYETGAITRYVDEVFDGPRLQSSDPLKRARANQIISIADNYVYPILVWGIYVERVSKPSKDGVANEAAISAALPRAVVCLKALSELMGRGTWLAGAELSLADLHAAPMFHYFLLTQEGRDMMQRHVNLASWWVRMAARPSMLGTMPS
ncbi:glutathione S-transferase family protein [Aminobacter sp. AP02]|uniref:glutathione S-transferase family protein n=1 Tax=Aminobacter sp. AP02 TaxID=2135737 RepID=UPI000D6B568F|nr:glutathione S-transferase family protein [Aminobacter sp. AP02]PWK72857.1 glutathione S-transferase [Aminobacter sp. AP02]